MISLPPNVHQWTVLVEAADWDEELALELYDEFSKDMEIVYESFDPKGMLINVRGSYIARYGQVIADALTELALRGHPRSDQEPQQEMEN